MCTISILPFEGSYSLFMNRDESPLRPQTSRLEQALNYAYPVDAKSGGTWIGLNEHGLALCLMNQHPEGWRALGGLASRGLLIPSLLASKSADEALSALQQRDLAPYTPFLLFAAGSQGDFQALRWDGHQAQALRYPREALLLCSSAVSYEEVRNFREALFTQGLQAAAPQTLEQAAEFQGQFHRSHEPEKGALSVCLHRPDAISVSLSELRVSPQSRRLRSSQGPVCEASPPILEASF